MSLLLAKAHEYLAQGAVSKGWGGKECYDTIPLFTHITESFSWIFVCYWFASYTNGFKWFRTLKSNINQSLQEYNKSHPNGNPLRIFEIMIGTLHIVMYGQLMYYKYNDKALIYLLQPCHPIMLLQGIALLSNGSLGVLISIFILPSLTGTLLAMLFPETSGLMQPYEMEAYWIQHYLIQFVPFYLLLRRNSLALKYANYQSIIAGIWILTLIHFVLLESIDLTFMVNVDFILCPTSAMVDIFGLFPEWLFLPSYRTFMTIAVCLVGTLISYVYIYISLFIHNIFLKSSTAKDEKNKKSN